MRRLLATLVVSMCAATPVPAEEITACDGLSGTVLAPGGGGRAVLIVPGSGPTDRDGDNPAASTAATYRRLAEALAAHGIGSLRYDKRGIGRSVRVAREEDVTMDSSAADATCLAALLAARADVRRVTVLGHSEGGLHAMRVARALQLDAILVATPGRPALALLADQLRAAGVESSLQTRIVETLQRIAAGETVSDMPADLAPLARPSIQPFLRGLLRFDPAQALADVRGRVLIIGGGTDVQVTRADFDRLAGSRSELETVWLADMNHVLRTAPQDRAANLATYRDPALPLAQGLVDRIVAFLNGSR